MSSDDPKDLAVLYAIASLANSAPDAAFAPGRILATIMAAFPADSGSLALLSPETGLLEICIQHGLPPDIGDFALKPGQGVTGWVALHGQPLLVADSAAEPRYIAARAGVRSEMAAPLAVEGHTIGVVNLDADRPGAFTSADLARLARFAAEAGGVLHRLWQYERLRTNSTQLTTLVELGHALVTQLEPGELSSTLTHSGRALFNARLCLLHDYDGARDELRLSAWSAAGGPAALVFLPQQAVPADAALLTAAIRSGRATEFQHIDGPGFREAADLPRDPSLRSALAVPLVIEDKSTGVLSVFWDKPHRFSDDEKRLLTALASFAAVALQNARLYARIFQSEEVLRKNETLTTLGLLAAEIAHEIRNPLTVIKLLHGALGVDFPPDDPRRRDLQVITEKIEQLEGIVSRVLSFARAPAALHSRWALAEILDDTLALLRVKLAQAPRGRCARRSGGCRWPRPHQNGALRRAVLEVRSWAGRRRSLRRRVEQGSRISLVAGRRSGIGRIGKGRSGCERGIHCAGGCVGFDAKGGAHNNWAAGEVQARRVGPHHQQCRRRVVRALVGWRSRFHGA